MSTNCYTNTNMTTMNNYNNNNNNNKDLKKKPTKTFDLSQIAEDPMDIYLESLGLWKKRIARDGSCLFRAVAEQIYPCQMYHTKVREECIDYMSANRLDYEKHVSIPFDDYLESMRNPLEYGGQLEILAMSKLYKRDFIIYQQPNSPSIDVTQNGYKDKILISYSYNNHFDAIFTKTFRDDLALIQSLVYEILYEKVFGAAEQVELARELLRESDTIYPKEYMDARSHNLIYDENQNIAISNDGSINYDDGMNDTCLTSSDIDENSHSSYSIINQVNADYYTDPENRRDKRKMPFPFKVAKCLDPLIYRNTTFDAWLDTRKELEEELNQKLVLSLQPGERCLVRLNAYGSTWLVAYLQSLHNEFVNVVVPDLHESHCVTFDNIKPFVDYTTHQNHHHYHHHTHNVQKLVQPINSQFSQIFANSENKRRNLKKKQFAMKKSSSFHAFSTELPTLHEVNEDQGGMGNDDLFHYHQAAYDYYNPMHAQPASYNHNGGPQLVHSLSSYANFSSEKIYGTNQFNPNNNTTGANTNGQMYNNMKGQNNNLKKNKKYSNTYKPWTNNNPNQNYNNLNGLGMGIVAPQNQQTAIYPPQGNNPALAQQPYAPYTNGTAPFVNNPYAMYAPPQCDSTYYYTNPAPAMVNNKQINPTDQQQQRRRHGSSESYLSKQQATNPAFSQQVPQHMSQPPQQQQQLELGTTQTNNNYLLMPAPAPQPPQVSMAQTMGGMQRSHSYHAGISSAAYDTTNQPTNAPPVYIDLYMPPPPPQHTQLPPVPQQQQQQQQQSQNPQPVYTSANGQSMMVQQNQPLFMNATTNSGQLSTTGASLYTTNGCMDNTMSYDLQYPRMDNTNDQLLNIGDANRQNLIWNKNAKLGKNYISSFPDMVYNDNQAMLNNQQPYCYAPATNCFVVNIDGPINFNATHSVMEDGSDLKLNDINTLRFFYNLGIEYYRLNIATNNAPQSLYYQPNTNTVPIMNQNQFMNNSKQTTQQMNPQDLQQQQQQNGCGMLNDHNNNNSNPLANQQVVPSAGKQAPTPLMHPSNQTRRIH